MDNLIDYIKDELERLEQFSVKPKVVLLSPADKEEIEKSTVIFSGVKLKSDPQIPEGTFYLMDDISYEKQNNMNFIDMTAETFRQLLLEGMNELRKSSWYNNNTNGARIIREEAFDIIEKTVINKVLGTAKEDGE